MVKITERELLRRKTIKEQFQKLLNLVLNFYRWYVTLSLAKKQTHAKKMKMR